MIQRLAALLGCLLLLALSDPAAAQGLVGEGAEGPLQIDAEDGIEWRRDEQVYIARGNATATRGQVTVYGDRLIAHYRDTGGNSSDGSGNQGQNSGLDTGDTEIFRLEAVGSVRIVDQRANARGDRGVYDLDQQVVVLTGDDLQFETEQETITAEDSLEYWEARDLAVARGDAVAVREDRRIQADVLTARFDSQQQDGAETASAESADSGETDGGEADGRAREIERIEAFGNVRISTPEEYARGDRGVYNTRTQIATLTGNVRLTRGDNQLNGGWGQVNLETGVSRLLGAPPESGETQRVRALLEPNDAENTELSETGAAEAEANAEADGSSGSGAQGQSEDQQ